MKDVKAITIPEGTVKKIENANGDIIWGSQSAFPYRRLEYVQGDGTNYILTNLTVNRNAEYWFEFAFPSGAANALSGSEKTNAASNTARFKFGTNSNGVLYMGYGSNVTSTTTPTVNAFYNFYAKTGTQWIKDDQGTTIVSGTASLTTTSSALSSSKIAIFGITQDSDTTLAQVSNSTGVRIRKVSILYGGNTAHFFPCQRKSDGKLGLYNVYNNTFYPELGSGALVAGPVLDEYWDLTAPA